MDQLADKQHKENLWKTISMGSIGVIGFLTMAICFLSYQVSQNFNRTQYIIAPGAQMLSTVRPGELPSSYIEQAFRFVTEKLNSWTYASIKDNYKVLFEQFYTHTLKERTQASLNVLHYFEDTESRKLVSFWNAIPEESEFHWCGKVSAFKETKGVACGIVTGEQHLYADHSIPVSTQKISYLIYAVNVAPTPNNFFAVQVTRIKRGPLGILKAELERSLKDGVLPSEENSNETN